MNKELLTSSVGIVMPTCNPTVALTKLLPSVEYIKELAPIATWLINFNGPWNRFQIDIFTSGLRELGFGNTLWRYSDDWDKPIKLIKMREMCAELDPDCDLYLFIDDDFKFLPNTPKYPFSSGRRYLHSIDYMTRFPRCGVVNTKSFLGGTPQKLKIIPVKHDMQATGQGLFLRNMKKHGFTLALKEMREIRGGLEEQTMCYLRTEFGFFSAKQMNNPTIHITGKLSDWDNDKENFHNIEVIDQNLAGWIRNRYQPDWEYQHRKAPARLWESYTANGGIELTNELIINYAEYEPQWDASLVGLSRKRRKNENK